MQFTQFLSSIKSLKTNNKKLNRESDVGFEEKNNSRASGFVFVKDSGVYDNDFSAIQEAKSLNSIRTALENLEDLEFFHTSASRKGEEDERRKGEEDECAEMRGEREKMRGEFRPEKRKKKG
ncbi:hypothetical protein DKX38_018733 [Salix brachista]|uniref:Uncharacterized protein n=1 Tax=Salix brachista TaxID=2182728 RepID=A0A5N5KNV5_9ROSI|nr:hypothetical protein DKX38_018733 [Salix brachista]